MEPSRKKILLTGGLGYIGSHTAVIFAKQGYDLIILDNLSNSSLKVLDKIKSLTWQDIIFYNGDIKSENSIEKVFRDHEIDGVIHFAAKKSVWESCLDPFSYYHNNILGTINLFSVMNKYNVKNIVFSSSATVYDANKLLPPFVEIDRVNSTNPYGTTKLVIEYLLRDLSKFKDFYTLNLRYFNPIGAHDSGLLGEDPKGTPSNLLPYMLKVATGELEELKIYGNDYDTEDGTWIRDYLHVMDLAEAHFLAYQYIDELKKSYTTWAFEVFNVGTGHGTSVTEMLNLVEQVIGRELPHTIVERRDGDVDVSIANTQKIRQMLGWSPQRTLYQAVEDAWNFTNGVENTD